MSGKQITQQQVNLYMNKRKEGLVQTKAAAQAAISDRTGRRIEYGQLQPQKGKIRRGRTRQDPLAEAWEVNLLPKLEAEPLLSPMTLLEVLQKEYPGDYPDTILRTLQRRVKQWKALYGPEKEVMFLQEHPVGEQGLSDFTTLKEIKITIEGKPFHHLLYHFRFEYR